MSIIQASSVTGSTGAYQIERSLRFNSADSAYLNRTFGTPTSKDAWSLSGWVKRASLATGSLQTLVVAFTNASNYSILYFATSNELVWLEQVGGVTVSSQVTSAVYRDPSAFMNIQIVWDSLNATAGNRAIIYVNGVRATVSSPTNPNSGQDSYFNTASVVHEIGRNSNGPGAYLNAYLTELHFVDGQALTPSSFGEFNPTTGVWQPIEYTGTYGTNGFYLPFSDNSSTTTLGDDFSGNNNDWTTNNFSVTAGAGNDSLVDSPTRYGTDTGAGGEVRGNYCTLNPLQLAGVSLITLANGNLDITFAGSVGGVAAFRNIAGTIGVSSGKWYWEVTYAGAGTFLLVGITDSATLSTQYTGQTAGSYAYYSTGQKVNNASLAAYGASYTTNDVIGVALDMDAGTITFYKNNVSQGQAYSGITGTVFPAIGRDGTSNVQFIQPVNFGQRPFAYTAPSGFKALVTTNLPTPTIEDGSQYFDATTYTGNGGTNTIVNSGGMQPDLVWLKRRSSSSFHALVDSVRGVNKYLYSDLTNAEGTVSPNDALTSLNSNGFTLGANLNSGAPFINDSGATFVGWQWKANGAGVTNTAGTITSTVSVNTTSGFSIVTYTGTGANATVGHGLGVAPKMVIVKNRDTVIAWLIWHIGIANTQYLVFDTNAVQTAATAWNSTSPTSTVFSIGTSNAVNESTKNLVAYCFAEVPGYSAFGSYTGNGSADGPFVYTGFRPRYVLVKCSSAGSTNWVLHDTAREPYNLATASLYPNLSNAETVAASQSMDILSNGFKLRNISGDINTSSATYIFAAFAENPVKYSLGR
jgi:hypothetical protein